MYSKKEKNRIYKPRLVRLGMASHPEPATRRRFGEKRKKLLSKVGWLFVGVVMWL
jgi:hypothetical protein